MGANNGTGLPGICCWHESDSSVVPCGSAWGETTTSGFETGSGAIARVTFSQRPLGLKCAKSIPLTVTEVIANSQAHVLGVQEGWIFRGTGTMKFDNEDACGMLARRSAVLPLM